MSKVIEIIVKKILRQFGWDIVRFQNTNIVAEVKSVRTKSLTEHKTMTGTYFLPTDAKADVVAKAIINNEIFEREVVELASKYIRKGTAVLDLGSNFGQMSILFSNLVGEDGHVYSFDADDFVFEILKKNIAANNKQKNI